MTSKNIQDRWYRRDRETDELVKTAQHGVGMRYRARYRDDAGKEHARHFGRKTDAKRWLDETTAAVVTGQYVDPRAGTMTFAYFYAQWSQRQIWVASTRRGADLAAASVTFGQVPLRSLRRSHIEQWVKTMSRYLAASTIQTRMNIIRSVLRGAVADRVIATDPSVGVVLPRRRKREAAMQIPTPDEVAGLLAGAQASFRPFVAVCAFAGLRLGEAAGLRLGDVDFLRRQLAVARQLQREGRGVKECPPKYGSERTVYVADDLLTMLAEHVADYRAGESSDAWLFVDASGRPMHPNAVDYQWRRTRKSAGLPEMNLHSLRHFFASGLIANGCDVVTVQRALGHAKASTTLNTYMHLWPTAEDKTRRAAAAMMSGALGALADSVRTGDPH